jgi:hypothetical protein
MTYKLPYLVQSDAEENNVPDSPWVVGMIDFEPEVPQDPELVGYVLPEISSGSDSGSESSGSESHGSESFCPSTCLSGGEDGDIDEEEEEEEKKESK